MKIRIQQSSALHEKGGRFKNEDFIYPILDSDQIDSSVTEAIPNIPGLYMICDGVGGEQKGEVASQLAVAQFAKYFETFPPNGQVTYGYLSAALIRVEDAFSNYLKLHPDSRGMGSTLALLYIDGHGAMLAWIGDSRIYHIRKGDILYKTRDHSLVNDLIEQGEITEAAARYHPRRNVVLRVIKGTEEATDLDTHFINIEDIEAGDYFFLCSDGVLEEVNENEIKALFSGEFSTEDIRHEVFNLCQDNSNDNFSAYIIQLEQAQEGIVAEMERETLAAASVVEDEEEVLMVEDVVDPPEESGIDAIPAATVTAATTASILDQLDKFQLSEDKEEKTPASSTPSEVAPPPTQTVFDRLNQSNKEQTHKQKETEPQAHTTQTAPPPQEDHEDQGNRLLPALLISIVLLSLVAVVWLFQKDGSFFKNKNSWKTSYQTFMTDAQADFEAGKYRDAKVLADSALTRATTAQADGEIAEAEALKQKAAQAERDQKLQRFANLQAMGEEEVGNGTYPSFWRAKGYYEAMIKGDFDDIIDGNISNDIQSRIVQCDNEMAKFSDAQKFDQLMARAAKLCNEGVPQEAELFFTEAERFSNKLQKDDVFYAARDKCMETPVVEAEKPVENESPEQTDGQEQGQEQVADAAETTSRGLSPADANTSARTTSPAQTTDNTATDNNTTPPVDAHARVASQDPAAKAAPTAPAGGSFTAETAVPVSEQASRGGASARLAGGGVGSLESQQASLKKGKSLFNKSAASGSKFEAGKAAEYIEQAGPAVDGEGYYMLADLYHKGNGVEQDKEQALKYAELSKKNNYTGGYYLYGVYLLESKSKIDQNNAVSALRIAAKRGYKPAVDKLNALGI